MLTKKKLFACLAVVAAAADDLCSTAPFDDFCLCATDADCAGTCVEFRRDPNEAQNGICITAAEQNEGQSDPCDRSQNDPYHAGDCVLQSRRENPEFACDGAHYNLDLYVRSNRPGDDSFHRAPRECVIGYNLLRVAKQTIQQCQQLCRDYRGGGSSESSGGCVAVEFGVDYGGKGLSTAEHTACSARLGTTTPGAPATDTGSSGNDGYVSPPTPRPTPAPTPQLLPDFASCSSASECASGGCFNLAGARSRHLETEQQHAAQQHAAADADGDKRRNLRASTSASQQSAQPVQPPVPLRQLQQRVQGGTCADPASFRESGPDSVCQFPFVFRGQTFTTCITAGDAAGRAWCSTKVDSANGRVHVSGGGFIHYCKTPAPTPWPTPPPTPPAPTPPRVVYLTPPPTPAPPPPAPAPVIIGGGGGFGGGGFGGAGCFGLGGVGCGFGGVCCNGVCCGVGQYCSGIGFAQFCRNSLFGF